MEQNSTEKSTIKLIFKTAIITALALTLAFILIAVFVFFCFPLQGYKFTNGLGMKKSALFFAERYASDGENMDGLVYCIELDKALIDETGNPSYDEKMISHTEMLLGQASIGEAYFKQLDEYYIANSDKAAHVGLYSYKEYLTSNNFVSRVRLGKCDEMVFRFKPTPLADIMKAQDKTNSELAIIYLSISKALYEVKDGDFSFLVKNDKPTDFLNELKLTIPKFIGELADVRDDKLKELFLMRSVLIFLNEICAFFDLNDIAAGEWYAFYSMTGESKLDDEYTRLYKEYIQNK